MEIVDAHVHIGDLSIALPDHGRPPVDLDPDEDIKNRVRAMEQFGVSWAVVQPSHAYVQAEGIKDTMRVNDGVADYRRRDPVHFPIALGTVEPMHGEASLDELDRIKHDLHLEGVSWHHRFQGCTIDSKWMRPILRRMADLELVPFVHTNAESHFEAAWQLQRLASEFPEMTFVSMDAFYASERGNQVWGTAKQSPNIIWDIGGPISYISVDTWVRSNGSETICFSGAASYPTRGRPRTPRLLEEMERSRLPDADKANIYSLNIRRLFRLPPEGPVVPSG